MKVEKNGFDSLPDKVSAIYLKVDRIEQLLNDHPSFRNETQDKILTINEAAEFTSLAKQTIYQLVSERKIPFIKRKGTKRLYFSQSELREWIMSGRKKVQR